MLLRAFKWLGLLILVVLVTAAAAVALIDWGFLKEPIESRVSRLIGRQVTIAGGIDIDLALHPRLIARRVRLANADWSDEPYMLEVETLAVTFDPLDWLTGTLGIDEIRIEQPRLRLERASRQRANWQFALDNEGPSEADKPQQEEALPVDVSELTIADASIYFRDRMTDRELTLSFDKLHLKRQGEDLALNAAGKVGKQPFQLQATGGTWERLLAEESAYPLKVQLRSEQTELRVQGHVAEPLAFAGVHLDVALEGKELSRWSELAGMELPELPVFKLRGILSGGEGIWRLSDLQSHLKTSDLGGNIVLNNNRSPPRIEGKLHSSTLDVKELQAALPEKDQPQGFSLPPLGELQTHLEYAAEQLVLPQMSEPVKDVAGTVVVKQGTLYLRDFGFDLGGGRIRAEAKLSEGAQTVRGQAAIELSEVSLAQVSQRLEQPMKAPGTLEGRLQSSITFPAKKHTPYQTLLRQLRIEDGALTYSKASENTHVILRPRTVGAANGEPRVRVAAEGRYRGSPIQLTLRGDPLAQLLTDRADYTIEADLESRSVRAHVTSSWGNVTEFEQLAFRFNLQIENTADLEPWIPTSLPPLPAVRLTGKVQHNKDTWTVKKLDAAIGDTAFTGSLAVEMGRRPYVEARLDAERIVLADLLTPEPSTAEDSDQAATAASPSAAVRTLQQFDGKLNMQAESVIISKPRVLHDVALTAILEKGQLQVTQLDLEIADGTLRASGALDAGARPVQGQLNVALDDIHTAQLWDAFTRLEENLGTASGELHLHATAAEPKAQASALPLPFLGRLTINDTHLHFVDVSSATDLNVTLRTQGLEDGSQRSLMTGQGRYRNRPFRLNFTADPLLDLRDPQAPYGLEMALELADTEIKAQGTLQQPLALKGMDLTVSLQGPDPRRLYPLLGIPLPSLPPYSLQGQLVRHDARWQLSDLVGRVGDSDLKGEVKIDVSSVRPEIIADLQSNRLDLDDLGGLVGATPGTGADETISPQQRRRARQKAESPKLLPSTPINLQRLQTVTARVAYHGDKVTAKGLPLDDLTIKYRLQDGNMVFAPVEFGIGSGTVGLKLMFDIREQPMQGTLEATIEQVNLRRALRNIDIADESMGVVGGRAKFWIKGNSVADLLGSADGGMMMLMTGGKLDALLVELAGLDAGEALLAWLGEPDPVPIDCAYADLQSRSGVLKVKTFMIDSQDTLFLVDGKIDLRQERLDLVIHPHPKDTGGPAAPSPLSIRGSFKDPDLEVDMGSVAARATAAVALSVLAAPIAALMPLLDPEEGENSPYCSGLVERIQQAK
ncbi:MAG: AsmA family protein [Gammaproteobacteria bacterium]